MKRFLIPVILACLIYGCDLNRCANDASFKNSPGVCGKIYRMEQAKNRYRQYVLPAIFVLFGLVFLPVLLKMCFRFLVACLAYIARFLRR